MLEVVDHDATMLAFEEAGSALIEAEDGVAGGLGAEELSSPVVLHGQGVSVSRMTGQKTVIRPTLVRKHQKL
jgi:hypothetical protein